MKIIIFILAGLLIFQFSFSQKKKIVKSQECNKGTYWLTINSDKKNPDSIRVFGSIKRIHKNTETDPYGYVVINKIKYQADRNGNFDFKIRPGKYSVFVKTPYTYGITTEIVKFGIGAYYEFTFYLKGLPPIADYIN